MPPGSIGGNMDTGRAINLCLCVEEHLVPGMLQLLQIGFLVKTRVGCSIKEFLCGQQHLPAAYMTNRVDTVFLDGKPVDDFDSAAIRDGSTLALSGAMPGLAGTVMRRGSSYAAFRHSITYREKNRHSPRIEGMVRLKLFNMVLKELGPYFLEKGIFVGASHLNALLMEQSNDFRPACREILLNHRPVDFSHLEDGQLALRFDWVFLTVKTVGMRRHGLWPFLRRKR